MPGIDLIRLFLERANAQGSRSTALQPLIYVFVVILGALLIASFEKASEVIVISLLAFAGLIFIVIVVAYLFFMVKSPDALRSEKFTLSKMAIEKSISGDTLSGFVESYEQVSGLLNSETTPEDQ